MALPRPEQVVLDVESVVREYLRPSNNATTSVSPAGDLPPKYEDLEDFPPPQYDESTMRSDPTAETVADENISQQDGVEVPKPK